jgi:hypothetical protein
MFTCHALQFYGFSEPDLADDCYVMTRMLSWLEKMRGQVPPARLQALKDAQLMEAVTMVSQRLWASHTHSA